MKKLPKRLRQMVYLADLLTIKRLTLKEIKDRFNDTEAAQGDTLNDKLFYQLRDTLYDVFGIDIEYFSSDYTYHVTKESLVKAGDYRRHMLDIARTGVLLMDNFGASQSVILEDMPSGDIYLSPLLEAMQRHHWVNIFYKRYSAHEGNYFNGAPVAIVQRNKRWYLLLELRNNKRLTLSLDRILDLSIDNAHSFQRDEEITHYYDNYYGIYTGDNLPPVQCVTIRAHGERQYYLDDLKLHHSQEQIAHDESYADYNITLRPGEELISDILRLEGQVEVLSPQWLRDVVRDKAMGIAKLFS